MPDIIELAKMQETQNKQIRFEEAQKAMQICNACRYCESLCPVFPALTEYRTFDEVSINYLANLCHNCKACYHGCQYAAPHEFDLNIPKTFAEARVDSYIKYSFPNIFGKLFSKSATITAIITALCITLLFLVGMKYKSGSLFQAYTGEGSFYQVIPFALMSNVALFICIFALMSLLIGFARFWREDGDKLSSLLNRSLWKQAFIDATTLKHLDGGDNKHGCNDINDRFDHLRKRYHHGVMYGFILTLISTTIAAIYHKFFNLQAPYDYLSLPVITGTLGGFMMVIGTIGLFVIKLKTDPIPVSQKLLGMDFAFIISLNLVNVTGLLLLFFREGVYMPFLLCLHLGFVLSFFVMMPYSKFVHFIYRFGALLKYAKPK